MKTPYPFEPLWTIFSDTGFRNGYGLLGQKPDGITKFEVVLEDVTVSALPSLGHILFDGNLKVIARPGPLLWFRRMVFQMADKDRTRECTPDCLYYGLGFGDRIIVKIYPDGKVE